METQKLTFYGEPISKYGTEQGFVDYNAIANAGNLTLCNNVTKLFQYFNFERINENETSKDYDIFQWYIIDAWTADILQNWLPDEILYYCEELDLNLWGVTHCGTRWDYVLTPIKIVKNEYGGFDFEKPQLSDDGGDDEL